MKTDAKEKRYQTNLKSASGTFAMAAVLNLIYIVKFAISKNFDFWFGFYATQYILKASKFTDLYGGAISKTVAAVLLGAVIIASIVLILLLNKNAKNLWICLAVYLADTAFMAWGFITDRFSDFTQGSLIDLIFHIFVLLFVAVGIVSHIKHEKEAKGN